MFAFFLDTIIPTDVTKSIDESDGTESTTEEIATTEPASVEDGEWEIVPADECEDGEWVTDVPKTEELKITTVSFLSIKLFYTIVLSF